MQKRFYILEVLIKTILTTENRSTVLHNVFLLVMSIFNEIVIKNDPVKKTTPFLCFYGRAQLPHDQVLGLENRTFHHKILSKLYCNSKFNISVNFKFVLSTS